MNQTTSWKIVGDWFDNCSCAVACPCTFAQPPDNGHCDFVLFWYIDHGHYGEVMLDDLSFVRLGRWEGDMWAGKAKSAGGVFIDDRAEDRQADALQLILGGRVGGWPERWGALFTEGRELRGVERARITFETSCNQRATVCSGLWGTRVFAFMSCHSIAKEFLALVRPAAAKV